MVENGGRRTSMITRYAKLNGSGKGNLAIARMMSDTQLDDSVEYGALVVKRYMIRSWSLN